MKAAIYIGNPSTPSERLCEDCAGSNWVPGVARDTKSKEVKDEE